jgi:hypothetical protein
VSVKGQRPGRGIMQGKDTREEYQRKGLGFCGNRSCMGRMLRRQHLKTIYYFIRGNSEKGYLRKIFIWKQEKRRTVPEK